MSLHARVVGSALTEFGLGAASAWDQVNPVGVGKQSRKVIGAVPLPLRRKLEKGELLDPDLFEVRGPLKTIDETDQIPVRPGEHPIYDLIQLLHGELVKDAKTGFRIQLVRGTPNSAVVGALKATGWKQKRRHWWTHHRSTYTLHVRLDMLALIKKKLT